MRAALLSLAMLAAMLSLAGRTVAAPPGGQKAATTIDSLVEPAMSADHLKSMLVQVRVDGRTVYSRAFGESMSGVPATTAMHFRNGAMAFTYMSTLLLELVDRKRVHLEDKLSTFFPTLPHAKEITLKNLADMTSGYADYVYQPELLQAYSRNPFRQWTPEELIHIGVSKPIQFVPGTNWGYSHTNYVILGRVLEKVTGTSLDVALRRYVFRPLRMYETDGYSTPFVPEPVLHSFSSERRGDLGIKPGVPFSEESTFWNPSWTTAAGAVETTTIDDMNRSMEAVGRGVLLSTQSYHAQIDPLLAGFGHKDAKCPACNKLTAAGNYGLGVVNLGPWITQTKNFAGAGATAAYLPSKRIAISVATTLLPEAFDDKGNYPTPSSAIVKALADALAPGTYPKPAAK